ncbi:MAG: UDP-glucose--hexose-1-phosphate uridylyltransferase, partial [Clostridia bacterium]|nr:UDP-glucose--hexose-1-phosphate uridylyltransferase [Clostridia bacterium]
MINESITELIDYAFKNNLIEEEDRNYSINRILNIVGENSYQKKEYVPHKNIEEILSPIIDTAVKNKKIENDTTICRDIISAEIMDVFMPKPSEFIKKFYKKYEISPKTAIEWFYSVSKSNNYIMT